MASWTRFAIALGLAALLALSLRPLLRSDEDRIRGLIAHAEEGWNDGSARGTVAPLAEDFRLAPFGMGKPTLRSYLLNIYRYNRDPRTRDFLYRAEVDWERVELEFVDAERSRAHVRGRLRVERTDGSAQWEYEGEFRVIAMKREGEWRIAAAGLQGLGNSRRPPREARKKEEGGGAVAPMESTTPPGPGPESATSPERRPGG